MLFKSWQYLKASHKLYTVDIFNEACNLLRTLISTVHLLEIGGKISFVLHVEFRPQELDEWVLEEGDSGVSVVF